MYPGVCVGGGGGGGRGLRGEEGLLLSFVVIHSFTFELYLALLKGRYSVPVISLDTA